MKKGKYKLNILILILVTCFVLYLVLKDNFNEVVDNILKANILFLVFALLLMVLNILFQSFSMHLYLTKIDPNYKFKDTFLLMFSALFFNAITPFSSGGQPFQAYILNKQGIKVTDSVNALLQNFLSYQTALTIFGVVSIILNSFLGIIPNSNLLMNIVVIGFFVNLFVLFVLIFLTKAKKLNTKLFNKIFDFIFGFKFIKNRESLKEKAKAKIDEFYNSELYFKEDKHIFLKATLLNMVSILLICLIPLLVFYSIGNYSVTPLKSIVCSSYTYFIGSFVPIPGGTGGLEYAFIEFFKSFTNGTMISVCMILWRFITYYFSMILGAISLIFIKKRVKK